MTLGKKPLPLAFSPCPNDTFLFHAWVHQMGSFPLTIDPITLDIQKLNTSIKKGTYPISKVSINCLGHILSDYILLPTGCALGFGNGPKIIARENFPLSELHKKKLAIPGKDTTAHLLQQVLCPNPAKKIFCSYDEIIPLILQGKCDAGIILHETRFTFQHSGLTEITDLGHLFEKNYQLPLPLGGIVAKRNLGNTLLQEISTCLKKSLTIAKQDPTLSKEYIKNFSIEKDEIVIQKHIDLFVNEETMQLSTLGIKAIDKLLSLGEEKKIFSIPAKPWLFTG